MRTFMQACQNTLDMDADLEQLCYMTKRYPLTVRQWIAANTWELSNDPTEWEPMFVKLTRTMLVNRLEAQ